MESKFDKMPIRQLVLRLGLPAMAAQLFNILYSIVDRIYVGSMMENGALALAAIGVCAPALTAIGAFAYMVGTGGSACMSIALGRRDRVTAQKMLNNSVVMLVIISIAVTALALAIRRPLLYMLGCGDNLYPMAGRYFTIYVCGTAAVLCGTGLNQFILAQGFARQGMVSIVIGAMANVVLDPIFIFALDMGIEGAALASVISQCLMCIYVIGFMLSKKPDIRISRGDYRLDCVGRILKIGIMPFLITLLDNLIIILLNSALRRYGGDELGDSYIAAAAVIQSFLVIVFCPAQGITTGCATLYGYHYGARNYDKLMQVFKYVFILCFSYIGILMVLVQLFPTMFVRLFMSDTASVALTASFLRKYTLWLIGVAVQYAVVDGLTATGKTGLAMPLSLCRKAIYIIMVLVLPMVTRLENIFYAGAVSDFLGSTVSAVVFMLFVRKRLRNELEAPETVK